MDKTQKEAPSMSLLSALMSNGTEGITVPVLSMRRVSLTSIDDQVETSDEPTDTSDENNQEEPPLSLEASNFYKQIPSSMFQKETSQRYYDIGRPRDSSLSFPRHNLAASPLTACSYQTMRKEYDMDTWRMYQRIKTARSKNESELLAAVHDAVGYIHSGSDSGFMGDTSHITEAMQVVHSSFGEVQDSECIFDLDM